jgi:hypothetical protein
VLDRKERLALRQRWLGEQEKRARPRAAMEKLRAAELADEGAVARPRLSAQDLRDDPDAGARILEAIAEHGELRKVSYRLDEEGGESDLASILDEIEQAQKAAAEMRNCAEGRRMRNCLKPKGGEE